MEQQLKWFLDPLKDHYFDFEGRVTRQAFWMFVLWSFIISIALGIFSDALSMVFSLAILLPGLGLGARRLHDTGKSGWWQLIGLIPLLGIIIMIVLLAQQGVAGANEYGPDPRQGASPMPTPPAPNSAPTAGAANPSMSADTSASTEGEVR